MNARWIVNDNNTTNTNERLVDCQQ